MKTSSLQQETKYEDITISAINQIWRHHPYSNKPNMKTSPFQQQTKYEDITFQQTI